MDETVETPTISKIIDYVLADPYEHIIYMDVKLKMVTSYDATNVFVDTGYKNVSGEPLFLSLVLRMMYLPANMWERLISLAMQFLPL